MKYNQRECNSCICKHCTNLQNCNKIDKRCNKCIDRKFKQIIYNCSLRKNYKGE